MGKVKRDLRGGHWLQLGDALANRDQWAIHLMEMEMPL